MSKTETNTNTIILRGLDPNQPYFSSPNYLTARNTMLFRSWLIGVPDNEWNLYSANLQPEGILSPDILHHFRTHRPLDQFYPGTSYRTLLEQAMLPAVIGAYLADSQIAIASVRTSAVNNSSINFVQPDIGRLIYFDRIDGIYKDFGNHPVAQRMLRDGDEAVQEGKLDVSLELFHGKDHMQDVIGAILTVPENIRWMYGYTEKNGQLLKVLDLFVQNGWIEILTDLTTQDVKFDRADGTISSTKLSEIVVVRFNASKITEAILNNGGVLP